MMRAQAPAAKSSSQPTRANPVPSSARPPAPPAARLGIGAGGRSVRAQSLAKVSVSGVGALARYYGANATGRAVQPSPHGGGPRSAFTIALPRVSAPLRAGKFVGGR